MRHFEGYEGCFVEKCQNLQGERFEKSLERL